MHSLEIIDLDQASSTPLRPEVWQEMRPYFLEDYGNPSSVHAIGRRARQALDDAAARLARYTGRSEREFIFTGGATEALNQGILGWVNPSDHIAVSSIEHHGALEVVLEHERRGGSKTMIAPDEHGMIRPEKVKEALSPETTLAVVMTANNEIGTIQPIKEIAAICDENNTALLTDAAQAVGYLDISEICTHAAMVVLSSAKIGGPKGAGVLIAPENSGLRPIIYGGGQQHRLRSGTENVPAIIGMVKTLEIAEENRLVEVKRLTNLRDKFVADLFKSFPNMTLQGHPTKRIPGNVHISIPGIDAEALVIKLDQNGLACSSGAACTAPMVEPSHVLKALNLPDNMVRSGVRFSFSYTTTAEQIDRALQIIIKTVKSLRATP
jgi:cysteine desulfurase